MTAIPPVGAIMGAMLTRPCMDTGGGCVMETIMGGRC